MLNFRFPSLHSLRQYEGMTWLIDTITNLYYFSIFQYHDNDTTNVNNINIHLTVIVSLRVPLLLTYNLFNLDVILFLFLNLLSACLFFISPIFCLTNLTTASLFLFNFGRYCEIRNSQEVTTLLSIALKLGLNASIFMRIEISRILHNSFTMAWGNSGSHNLVLMPIAD